MQLLIVLFTVVVTVLAISHGDRTDVFNGRRQTSIDSRGQRVHSVQYSQNAGLEVNRAQDQANQGGVFNGRRQTSSYSRQTGSNNEGGQSVLSVAYSQNAHQTVGLGVSRAQDSNQGGRNEFFDGRRQPSSNPNQSGFNNEGPKIDLSPQRDQNKGPGSNDTKNSERCSFCSSKKIKNVDVERANK
ncbi:uncharacterized protein LOC108112398 [Drosophila eugracilis]|uniref:uncharacterized protein LOC108112398 n=1 Tax=Drosophila eugracilis TaxID=29029 RepID=UPI0007E7D571|nr:uncharacterized protein LOC108112398 [Drosophila eugracilis]